MLLFWNVITNNNLGYDICSALCVIWCPCVLNTARVQVRLLSHNWQHTRSDAMPGGATTITQISSRTRRRRNLERIIIHSSEFSSTQCSAAPARVIVHKFNYLSIAQVLKYEYINFIVQTSDLRK